MPARPWTNGAKLGVAAATVGTVALMDFIKNRNNSKLGRLWERVKTLRQALRTSSLADVLEHLKRNKTRYATAVIAYFMLYIVLEIVESGKDWNRRLIGTCGFRIGLRDLLIAFYHWQSDRQPGIGRFINPLKSIGRQRYPSRD